MPSGAEPRRLYPAVVAGLVGLDLLTKAIVEGGLAHGVAEPVLGEWLQFRLVYNPGAAFGLLAGPHSRWIFLAIAAAAVVLLTGMAWRTGAGDRIRLLAYGLVAGGAMGNGIDRLRSPRGVVDFLDVGFETFRWPTFNLADIGVTCGAVALAVSFWLEDARRARAEPAPPAL